MGTHLNSGHLYQEAPFLGGKKKKKRHVPNEMLKNPYYSHVNSITEFLVFSFTEKNIHRKLTLPFIVL